MEDILKDVQKAVKTCLSKYADFNGRAARPEFWWFMLAQIVVLLIAGMISGLLEALVSLGLLLPGLAVGARRLHDIGKSGWLQLLWLVPIIGWAILIYWAAQPSAVGTNAYGNAQVTPESPTVMPGPGQQ
jgi:uncharacterized membrane protein YhaH (DUF805 family)